MAIIEKLTHKEKGKLKLLIHNVLESTELNNTLCNLIIQQRNSLKLESDVTNKFDADIKLKIRDI